MSTHISLERLVALRIPIAWHEAVALAQQIAEAEIHGISAGPDTCELSSTGEVTMTGTSPSPFGGDVTSAVLDTVLDRSQAPRELVALLERHQQGKSEKPLIEELKFFARPDSAAAIAAVVTRALAAEADARQREEFERLRQEAATTPATKKAKPSTTRSRRAPAMAAAAIASITITGGLALNAGRLSAVLPDAPVTAGAENASPAAPSTELAPLQQLSSGIDALVDKGLAALGITSGEPAVPVPAVPPPAVTPRREKRSPASRSEETASAAPLVVNVPPSIEPVPTAADPVVRAHAEPERFGNMIFDEGDADLVDAPVLRWPQLPNEPGEVVEPGTPYLELLINEAGTVDKVRLRSERNTFHDRMLVSAAKAWVFHPAQRDGQAVKYLLRVPIVSVQ